MLGGMTLDTRLEHDGGDAWAIRQDGETRAQMNFDALRISVSWKAYVYRDAEQRRRHEAGGGGLDLDQVVDRFDSDLSARGIAFEPPADPLHDEAFVDAAHARLRARADGVRGLTRGGPEPFRSREWRESETRTGQARKVWRRA